jgi:hypothetical protein
MDNVPPPTGNDQDAASSWSRTIRYCVIVLVERLAIPAAVVWLAWHP